MSIIANAEKYMKRYDYLIQKRERKYREGKRLSIEEDEELRILRPNVFTPIFMMFEVLHDTIKTNQEHRHASKRTTNQTGGALTSPAASAAAVNAVTAAAVVAAQNLNSKESDTAPPTDAAATTTTDAATATDAEAKRLSELEESLLPLLTKIIVYIEENKKAEKKKGGEDGDEEEKYPDIGTTAKNSAILVVRRIKKWWNDLISGGTSDLSSKINLKKAIPQLANNPDDMNNLIKTDEMNKLAEKATDAIHKPLQKIEKILSNDVRDIASSSVEGIMNALSLIPGIGTTLQLWRLLQNVIVIMSKSVTTMAGAKTEGVNLKNNIQTLKGDLEKMADPAALANAAANAAKDKAISQVQGIIPNQAAAIGGVLGGAANPVAAALTSGGAMDAFKGAGGVDGALSALKSAGGVDGALSAFKGAGGVDGAMDALKSAAEKGQSGGALGALKNIGGGAPRKTNHIRSIKKYKREYKQSIREIRKTRKNILRCIKNMI